jgi:hypothetical protein
MQPAWGDRGPDARGHVVLSHESSGEPCQIQERMGTPAPKRTKLVTKALEAEVKYLNYAA